MSSELSRGRLRPPNSPPRSPTLVLADELSQLLLRAIEDERDIERRPPGAHVAELMGTAGFGARGGLMGGASHLGHGDDSTEGS